MNYNAETKVWSGPKVIRDVDGQLLRELIWKNLSKNPEKVYQISDDDGSTLTYGETRTQAIRVAQNLQRLGVGFGDVIAGSFANAMLAASVVFGCTFVSAPIFPFASRTAIDPNWIKQAFQTIKPKVLILEEQIESASIICDVISEMNMDCKVFIVREASEIKDSRVQSCNEILKETGNENEFVFPVDGCTDATSAFIIPSSGTTGPPKGIALPGTQCKLAKYCWNVVEDPVLFTYSSIGWYTGFLALFCSVLNQGRRVICRQKFSPKNFGRIVKQYKVTNTITSTENATLLYQSADFHEDDFKSIKEFICGGERVPQSIRRHLAAKLPKGSFAVVYGATEAGIFTTFLKNVDFSGVRGSIVGRVRENVQCKVVEISSRKPLGPCEIGEILTIPEAHFNEYYGRAEQTKSAFQDGWYKTGDFGYIDENGFVYVFGRAVDMITCNKLKIHPAEIEEVIESINGVACACALNVDENAVAVLVIKLPDSDITEESLADETKSNLGRMKIEGGIYIVDDIPRTHTISGKIFRPDAKALAVKLMNEKLRRNGFAQIV